MGSKHSRMVYADADAAERVRIEPVPEDQARRFCLSDEEVLALSRQAVAIEEHYGRPMDIEWAKDGDNGQLYIVQARPETVKSRARANSIERPQSVGGCVCEGRAIVTSWGPSRVGSIRTWTKLGLDVLVTDMTGGWDRS